MQKKLKKVFSRFYNFKLSRDDAFISFWCAFTFIGLGTTLVIFGPTLLDLSDHVGVSIASLAAVLFVRSVGSVIGASGSGFVCDKFHKVSLWMLCIDILILSFLTCLIPLPKNIIFLGVLMLLHGICKGALDNGVHAILMKIWNKSDTGPIMQVIHAMFALGAFLSPLITKPFLSTSTTINNISCAEVFNYSMDGSFTNDCSYLFTSCNETGSDWLTVNASNNDMKIAIENCSNLTIIPTDVSSGSNFAYAYWVAVIPLLIPIPPLIFYAFKRQCLCKKFLEKERKASEQIEQEPENTLDTNREYPPSKIYKGVVLFMLFIFMAIYVGAELSFGTYIFAFTVKGSLEFTKDQAVAITSLFWGTFTFMRIFSVVFSILKVPPSVMLGGNLTGSFTAALIMFIFKDSDIAIWISSGLMGTSMSAIYPNIMVWMSIHVPPTGKATGVLSTGSVLGDTLFPLFVGVLLDKLSPLSLIYITFIFISLCVIIGVTLFTGTKLYLRHWKKRVNKGDSTGSGSRSDMLFTYKRLRMEEVESSLVNEGAEPFDEEAEPMNNRVEPLNEEEQDIDVDLNSHTDQDTEQLL